MNKASKIFLGLSPILIGTMAVPTTFFCIDYFTNDLFIPSNQKKELILKQDGDKYIWRDIYEYLWVTFADKFAFKNTDEEKARHQLYFKIRNLQWDTDKVVLNKDKTEPKVEYLLNRWSTMDGHDDLINGHFGYVQVSDCTLKEGAWISFDLKCQLGTVDSEGKFTALTKYHTFKGFKVTFTTSTTK